MRFLRRNTTDDTATDEHAVEVDPDSPGKSYTPSKGRPTPKRREAEGKRRGPVAPAPRTTREAMKRSRANKGNKEERKKAAAERRRKMMEGDDKYLLPRDRGPVKAYVRDLVDSRRNILGLFMPLAIVVFVSLIVPDPRVQYFATLFCTVMLLGMVVEGVLSGRRITKLVRAKFPDQPVKGLSIGWYAFVRASQVRKLRVPKPRVKPGGKV